MPNIEMPDGKIVEFPDSMGMPEIQAVLDKEYSVAAPAYDDSLDIPGEPSVGELSKAESSIGRNIVAPVLKGGLMAGTGALASVAGPAGTAAGVGLGYGMGESIDRMLTGKTQPLLYEGLQTAKDVGTGAMIDTGFQTAFAGAGLGIKSLAATKPGQYLFDTLPKRLYASASKMPLSKKWTQTLPGKEVSKRTAATVEGIREEVPVSEFGVSKAKMLEKDAKQAVDNVIDELVKVKESKISTESVIQKGLSRVYQKAANSSDPAGAKAIIDKVAEKFRQHGEYLDPKKANDIKRQLYKESVWGARESTELSGQLTAKAKKGMSHEIMVKLEGFYPELKDLNATDAARIDLVEAIERAAGRLENTNIVPLGVKVLARPNLWPLAIWEATLGHPAIKTKIAFALAKASPAKYGTLTVKSVYGEVPDPFGKYTLDSYNENLTQITYQPQYSKTRMEKGQLYSDLNRVQPPGTEPIPMGAGNKGMPLLYPQQGGVASKIPPKIQTTLHQAEPIVPIYREPSKAIWSRGKGRSSSKGMPLIRREFSPGSFK